MSGFNAKTLQVLRQAGWHSNRRTDIAAIAARAAACGYEIGENVRAFVREFDGLSVGYPNGNFCLNFAPAPNTAPVNGFWKSPI